MMADPMLQAKSPNLRRLRSDQRGLKPGSQIGKQGKENLFRPTHLTGVVVIADLHSMTRPLRVCAFLSCDRGISVLEIDNKGVFRMHAAQGLRAANAFRGLNTHGEAQGGEQVIEPPAELADIEP